MTTSPLLDGFLRSCVTHPDRPAVTVAGVTLTYTELGTAALGIAARMKARGDADARPVSAVMASRTWVAYAGVLAALIRGHAYVPLNPRFPTHRNRQILERSGATFLIADGDVPGLLDGVASEPRPILVGSLNDVSGGRAAAEELVVNRQDNPFSYILFTSGSTGVPKGVAISHDNVRCYLDAVFQLLDLGPQDRFSQTFDLTFDLSVHDLFVCWRAGGHLIIPSRDDLLGAHRYIVQHSITAWFCVPSLAQQIRLAGGLRPASFPSLRTSLFCGEALPADLARAWGAAAPHSRVENWYGPTEATISCTRFVMPTDGNEFAQAATSHDLVPIGNAFPGMECLVRADDGCVAGPGIPGELLLGGRQVVGGYLDDPEKTAASFVRVDGRDGVFYRTGDRVVKDEQGCLHFLGRIDNQVKIRGYRVELGEIEAVIRQASGGHLAVVLPWPNGFHNPTSLMAAVEGPTTLLSKLDETIVARLPGHMVPARTIAFPEFPKNASGKVDRKEVAARVAEWLRGVSGAEQPSDPLEAALLGAVLRQNEALDRDRVLSSANLLEAGLDSLAFVNFTADLEKHFGLELTHDDVITLSQLSLAEIARAVSGRRSLAEKGSAIQRRAIRAIQFVERFPDLLRERPGPMALVVGSSGTFRAILPRAFEAEMRAAGEALTCINAGLPALSCEGIAQICEFIAEICEASGRRLAWGLLELDPMHLSLLPPALEIEIVPEARAGYFRLESAAVDDPEFTWNARQQGAVHFKIDPAKAETTPNWQKKRNVEIARTYRGHVGFEERAIQHWLRGVEALKAVSDRFAAFVHPINRVDFGSIETGRKGPFYDRMIEDVRARARVCVIDHDAFSLEPADFLNLNHVNAWAGMEKFSRQLARHLHMFGHEIGHSSRIAAGDAARYQPPGSL